MTSQDESGKRGFPAAMRKRKFGGWLLFIMLVIVGVVQFFPFWYLFVFSFKSNADIYGGNIVGLPSSWMWSNYRDALLGAKAFLFLGNSLFVSTITIVVSLMLAAMASFGIMRLKWRLSKFVLGFFLLGLMIPAHSTLLPLFLLLNKAKLLDSYLALILPYIAFALPMAILVLTAFLESVPKELEEAAYMEGAGVFRVFFSVVSPLMAPGLASAGILTFLTCYNELMFAVTFISNDAIKTLPVGILSLFGRYATNWGTIGASLMIASIPTIIVYLLFSNKIQKGLMDGALKG
ncbi:MAG: carbohydrate ABC transporter permease [Verrucomicrobiota bacterium]